MAAIKISEGMSADDVLTRIGEPVAIAVLGDEGEDEYGLKNLLVEWTYRSVKLTLARREKDGVTCYRVIEMEEV